MILLMSLSVKLVVTYAISMLASESLSHLVSGITAVDKTTLVG